MPTEMTEHKSDHVRATRPPQVKQVPRSIAPPNHRRRILLRSQPQQELSGLRGEGCCWERWAFWSWRPPYGSVFPGSGYSQHGIDG